MSATAQPPASRLGLRARGDALRARLAAAPRGLRERVELGAVVLGTAALVLGLGTAIEPTPRALPPLVTDLPSATMQAKVAAGFTDGVHPRPRVDPAFTTAVREGDVAKMKRLYIDDMPLDGALATAAEAGQRAALLWLLAHGADVTEGAATATAPVLLADARPDIVATLFAAGAKEETLLTAGRAGATNAVERILAGGGDPNPLDGSPLCETLLGVATPFPTKRLIADKLLAAGAKVRLPATSIDTDPLAAAVTACGAGPATVSPADCDALLDAILDRGALATGEALAQATGLPPALRDRVFPKVLAAPMEKGAPSVALAKAFGLEKDVAKALVARGVDWGWREGEDDAALPLVTAAERGDRASVGVLLELGAPADRHYKNGSSALGAAIEALSRGTDAENILEMLVARGADVNRRLPDGRTPLFAAAETGSVRAITFLLDRGARVNETILDDTALDAAEQNGHTPAARVIHARGGKRARRPD